MAKKPSQRLPLILAALAGLSLLAAGILIWGGLAEYGMTAIAAGFGVLLLAVLLYAAGDVVNTLRSILHELREANEKADG